MPQRQSLLKTGLKRLKPLLLIIAILAFFLVIFEMRATLSEAWTLATTKQPEKYTALYFNDPAHLPVYSPVTRKESIYFTIANHEAATTSYTYIATLSTGNRTVSLANKTVTITDGHNLQQAVVYTMPTANTNGIVAIKLVGRSEQLTVRVQS